MHYDPHFHRYLPYDRVSVYDQWLGRWRQATVVSASLTLVTAVSGGYSYVDLPSTPEWVRPVHIAYSSGWARELGRAA